jgi:hypothetical protein
MLPLTLQFVIAMIASAINERMRRRLDYALEKNRIPWCTEIHRRHHAAARW